MTILFGTTGKRLEDYMRAQTERDRLAEKAHDALRDQITELSQQTRGEFVAMKESVDRRHTENRLNLIRLATGIGLAFLASYLAVHGFTAPGITH